ncbi:hypothetical protein [Longimycelium tulufanense]|uniref:hypothetical protein n=1 Tax=Longimycelium tulufanense TaxID=907463 RepID=UPI001662B690|nr:hypothetical protein [Longimycelium tulufanense]
MGKDKDRAKKLEKLKRKARKCCRSKPRCKKCPVVRLLELRAKERAKEAKRKAA